MDIDYFLVFLIFLFYVECNNTLPDDYQCGLTCDDWATYGDCNTDWTEVSHCVISATGPIKNNCKMSCNQCGKYKFDQY